MKNRIWVFAASVLLSVFVLNSPVSAQYYKFQQYGVNKGICYPFVYQVTQDKNGFVWIMSGAGLCRFDGFNFTSSFKDTLPETSVTSSFKNTDGDIWFGYSNGLTAFFNGINFTQIQPDSLQSGSINDIITDKNNNILIATQSSGIVVMDNSFKRKFIRKPFAGKLIYSIALDNDQNLLVGGDDGISVYKYIVTKSEVEFTGTIDGLPLTKIQQICKGVKPNTFWVSTEDAGVLYIEKKSNGKYTVSNFGKLLGLEMDNVQSVYIDKQNSLWVSTFGKGVFKIKTQQDTVIQSVINYHISNGLGSNDIKGVFQDREGNMWISTFGNGISMLLTENFISFDYSQYFKSKNVSAVCFDSDGYWLGGDKGILKIERGIKEELKFYGSSNGLPNDGISALYIDKKGTLYIGTNSSGIFKLDKGTKNVSQFFKQENTIANTINAISGDGTIIYASTDNGIYEFNIDKNTILHHSTNEGQRLTHNSIRQVYVDKNGAAWIATQSSKLFTLNTNDKFESKGSHELEFVALTSSSDGSLWAGTNGNGVFKFAKDTVLYFSTQNNLKSDYCYALATDFIGNIWVGHRLGLSRITGVQPHNIKVYGSDFITGDINPNAIATNSGGEILFGTTDGLLYYESSLTDKKPIEPKINLTSIVIDDKNYDEWSEKIVLPYGRHRIHISFIGLSYNNPSQVSYQYKLDGYDEDWIDTKEPVARFTISDGNYIFKVKAKNGDGVWTETAYSFVLKIRKPFWKTWWFILLAIASLVTTVYVIIILREKKQKEFQIYLERLLDERTKEVREQKEEIELKNRDITDSINYAQRIQASILPSLRKLQHHFTGSFVYYEPRDIVSGDFYFFDILPNTNKFIVVCADSTGHGVPGAFMSLIGTTLLKDIFNKPDVEKPSDILMHLDKELKTTLNQNLEGERPNDGMDIIVCEIDITTYKTRFASAMRPFIVYQNGEQLYYKGSRSSIGGQIKEEKIFEDVELQLTKGDLIYMFSDGYPDQFGGPHGKKFKMVRLRNLLKDIHQKPMEEQYNYVKSNFDLWRGNLEQVDDVIFMGIKI